MTRKKLTYKQFLDSLVFREDKPIYKFTNECIYLDVYFDIFKNKFVVMVFQKKEQRRKSVFVESLSEVLKIINKNLSKLE